MSLPIVDSAGFRCLDSFLAVVTHGHVVLSDGTRSVTHPRHVAGGNGSDGDWSSAENEHAYLVTAIVIARHRDHGPQERHAPERAIWGALLDQARATGTAHWTGYRPSPAWAEKEVA